MTMTPKIGGMPRSTSWLRRPPRRPRKRRKGIEKIYRLKSLDMCCPWENISRVCCGKTLAHYVAKRLFGMCRKVSKAQWPPVAAPEPRDWLWLVRPA